MITFSKFKSSTIEKGKRILKILEFGVKTASECAPFGIDSNPIDGMMAIHSTTSNNSESVVIGYINKNQLSGPGETRLFSIDSNGALKSFLWLKSDGTIQLNGNDYTSVRFEPLKTGLQNTDTAVNAELVKIQTAITTLGGAYVPSLIATNIDNSKSDTVKLK